MAVKGLWQSDPHDARILKAFALGLAVATRGMDHLRNRVTLEINARINDDPAFKAELYGGAVSAEPNSYAQQGARGPRLREHLRGRRFGRHVPLHDEAVQQPVAARPRGVPQQLANVTGLQFTAEELEQCGLNIMGVERLINYRLGVRRKDDTLPDRWFDEPNPAGPVTRARRSIASEFDAMLSRFYEISRLTSEGVPQDEWRKQLAGALGA